MSIEYDAVKEIEISRTIQGWSSYIVHQTMQVSPCQVIDSYNNYAQFSANIMHMSVERDMNERRAKAEYDVDALEAQHKNNPLNG